MRNRISLKLGNFDSLYKNYNIKIPKNVKISMYLTSYFEGIEFDYESIVKEE